MERKSGMAISFSASPSPSDEVRAGLARRTASVRAQTLTLALPLTPEDQQVQSMPDASPTKWHLAHTTWFFETFVLGPHAPGFEAFDATFGYLFNSYYEGVGPRHPRPERGLLTRPSLERVLAWRQRTDDALMRFIDTAPDDALARAAAMIELGLHHEEQHQELILMDTLHLFSLNPLTPVYASSPLPSAAGKTVPLAWTTFAGGLSEIGHDTASEGARFAFDNESPRHKVWLEDYALANRLVTNGEFLEFIDAGGYENPLLWLADGWARGTVHHPLYWRERDGAWSEFTLRGLVALDPSRPVAHLSYYEADAYARFRGARLPSEAEWEHAACLSSAATQAKNLLEARTFMAVPARLGSAPHAPQQMIGDLWEWTGTAYGPYPGFTPAAGAVGEYNGKFMSGQMVLRGGSFATPDRHIRDTYRNFFYPHQCWAFSGLRLARDAG
jgi:ergothioneine biosynthesis protein EgtB